MHLASEGSDAAQFAHQAANRLMRFVASLVAGIVFVLVSTVIAIASPGCAYINSGAMDYINTSPTAYAKVTLLQFYPGDYIYMNYGTNSPKGGVVLTLTLTSISVNTVITGSTATNYFLDATMGSILPIGVEVGIVDATALVSPRNVTMTVRCNPALVPSKMALASSGPTVFGQTATLTATMTSDEGTPTGNVVFAVDGVNQAPTPIVSGVATLSLASLNVGTRNITASYAGDPTHGPITGTLTGGQVVSKAATTTSVISSKPSSTYGEAVTFTATVAATAPGGGVPTGSVIFKIDGNDQSPVSLTNGVATLTTSALGVTGSPHTVIATYSGSTNHATSAGPLSGGQTVGAASSTTSIGHTPASTHVGEPVTFRVTVGSGAGIPQGSVTLTIDSITQTQTLVAGIADFATTGLAVGPHAVSATYNGSTNIAGSSGSLAGGHTVTLIPTALTVTGPGAIVYGASAAFNVQVTSISGIPAGNVTLVVDGVAQTPVALNGSGSATITINNLSGSGSPHSISANYAATGNYGASSGTLSGGQVVTAAPTTTTVAPAAGTYGGSVELVATVAGAGLTPAGSVTFTVGSTTYPATPLSGGVARLTVSGLSATTHSISAVYSGSADHATSTGTGTAAIAHATPVVVAASTVNPSVSGQPVQLSATVSSAVGIPTGNVIFWIDNAAAATVALSNGQAVYSPTLGAGSHAVEVRYQGDSSFAPVTTPLATNQVVNKADALITVTSPTTSVPSGTPVTVNAQLTAIAPGVGVPTGDVVFVLDGSDVATVTLSGGAASYQFTGLSVDPHTIDVRYAGDNAFKNGLGSLSGGVTVLTIPTTLSITSNGPLTYGQTAQLTATVLANDASVPLGHVVFIVDGVTYPDAPLSGGVATLSLPNLLPKNYPVTASYVSSDGHQPATGSLTGDLVIGVATPTMTLTPSTATSGYNDTLTVVAAVSPADATGDVIFTVNGAPQTIALSGGEATLTLTGEPAGGYVITAVYQGDTRYGVASAALPPLTIWPVTTSATLLASPVSPVLNDDVTLTFTATSSNGTVPSGDVVFAIDGVNHTVALDGTGVAVYTLNDITVGPHTIVATYAAQGNFGGTQASLTNGITIDVVNATATISGPTTAEIGDTLQYSVTVTAPGGLVPTGNVIFTIDGVPQVAQPLSGGVATHNVTFTTAGSHSVDVSYLGTSSFAADGDSYAVSVDFADSTTLVTLPTSSTYGAPLAASVVVSSTAGNPTGTVSLYIDSVLYGSPVSLVGGAALLPLPSTLVPDSYDIEVRYSGDSNFGGSLFSQALDISDAATIVSATSNLSSVVAGGSIAVTVTVSSANGVPSGDVVVTIDGTSRTGSLSGGTVTVNVPVPLVDGTYPVDVTYLGTIGFAPQSTSLATDIDVFAPPTDVTLTLNLPRGIVGQPYVGSVIAAGGEGPYTYSVTGSWPADLTLNTTTGEVTGTPTVAGDYAWQIRAEGTAGEPAVASGVLRIVNASIVVMPNTLPDAIFGVEYNHGVSASGGTAPYAYAVGSGALPAGLALDPANGRITGAPSATGTANFSISVTDAEGFGATKAYQIVVVAPTITVQGVFPRAVQGEAYAGSVSVSGGMGPYVFTIVGGTLPQGLTLNADRTITGTPVSQGSNSFTVQATDANGFIGTFDVTLVIGAPPASIELDGLTSPRENQPYDHYVVAVGGAAPYDFEVTSGNLPPGLTLDTDGRLYGTPTVAGDYTFTITATDANDATGSETYALTVIAAAELQIDGALAGATAGDSYSATIGVTGGLGPYGFSIDSGSLPAGMVLNPLTGVVSGLPLTPGSYDFTVRVTDANGDTGTVAVTLVVTAPSIAVTVTVGDAGFGALVSGSATVSGGNAPYTFALSAGGLPVGVAINTSTGAIAGLAATAGIFNATITATDKNGFTGSGQVSFEIAAPHLVLTPFLTSQVVVGMAFGQSVHVAGGRGPYTFDLTSGALPAGLTLHTDTGLVDGTATATGTSSFVITATDQDGFTGSASYSINVLSNVGAAVLPMSVPQAIGGQPYVASVAAVGGSLPVSYAISGSLPTGLILNPLTGRIDGTTTALGSYDFTITAYAVDGRRNTMPYTLVVVAPTITAVAQPPAGIAGTAYSAQLAATGGTGPYGFSASPGDLPPGLAMDSNGLITGSPTAAGTFNFNVEITDANTFTSSVPFALTVAAPHIFFNGSMPAGRVGQSYTGTPVVTGGLAPYAFSVTVGDLPDGLTIDPVSGVVSGVPTSEGDVVATIHVADANGFSADRVFTFVIASNLGDAELPADVPDGVVDEAYSQSLEPTNGGGPYTYEHIAGTLPPGLSLNPTSGLLSGTPTTPGEYDFTVRVTDGDGLINTASYRLLVAPEVHDIIPPDVVPPAEAGEPYNLPVVVEGGAAPLTYRMEDGPDGLWIDPSTGVIQGTPREAGTFHVRVLVRDALNREIEETMTLFVAEAQTVALTLPDTIPIGMEGQGYLASVAATNGVEPVTYTIGSGALPTGLVLTPAGMIEGSPTTAGTYSFRIDAVDSAGNEGSETYDLVVRPALASSYATSSSLSAPSLTIAIGAPLALQMAVSSEAGPADAGNVRIIDADSRATLASGTLDNTGIIDLPVTFNTLGNRTLVGQYLGTTTYDPSTSPTLSITVVAADTTLDLSGTATVAPGDPVSLTATVTLNPPSQGTPTGSVTFTVNGTTHSTVPLSNGVAMFSATLPAGTYEIGATFQDANGLYNTSGDTFDVTVAAAAATSVALSVPSSDVVLGQSATYTATVTSAGPGPITGDVTFFDNTQAIATVAVTGGVATVTVTPTGVGTHTIYATYAGDATRAGSSSTKSSYELVSDTPEALPTTMDFTASNEEPALGETVTLSVLVSTGTATIPTGNVIFTDENGLTLGSVALDGSGAASFNYVANRPAITITATYAGDATSEGSSGSVTLISPGAGETVVTLVSSSLSVIEGQTVLLTATVLRAIDDVPAGGTVTFYANGVSFASMATDASGIATATSAALTDDTVFTARYAAPSTGGLEDSESDELTVAVRPPGDLTVSLQSSDAAIIASGQTIEIEATIEAAGGTVTGIALTSNLMSFDCPETELDDGESMVCTGTYIVTESDLLAGEVTIFVTASADERDDVVAQLRIGSAVGLVEETFRTLTSQFLSARARVLSDAIPLPDVLARRRSISDPGTIVLQGGDEGSVLGFSTSLRGIRGFSAALAADRLAMAPEEDDLPIDIWIDAKMTLHARSVDGGHWGNAGTVAAGADYLVTKDFLAGLMVIGDQTTDNSDAGSVSGTGFLIGPYVSVAFTDNLSLDAVVLYGRSSNTASADILGENFTGDFDTERLYAKATLGGFFSIDAATVRPNATLMLISEQAGDYPVVNADGDAVSIEGLRLLEYRATIGSAFEYAIALEEGATLTPKVGAELGLIGDVESGGAGNLSAIGQLRMGMDYRTGQGFGLGVDLNTQVDGSGFSSAGLRATATGQF